MDPSFFGIGRFFGTEPKYKQQLWFIKEYCCSLWQTLDKISWFCNLLEHWDCCIKTHKILYVLILCKSLINISTAEILPILVPALRNSNFGSFNFSTATFNVTSRKHSWAIGWTSPSEFPDLEPGSDSAFFCLMPFYTSLSLLLV